MHARELEVVSSPATPRVADAPPQQGTASVIAIAADGSLVLDIGGGVAAERAASCLLAPGVGDRVWFVADADARFVIAVLRRSPAAGGSHLRFDGDVSLEVRGRLDVASERIGLRSETELGLESDELTVRARAGRAFVRDCALVARDVMTSAVKSTFVGDLVETFADLLRSYSKSSVRVVEDIDQLEVGNIEHRAGSVAELAGKHVLINGSAIVKADASQIHLG